MGRLFCLIGKSGTGKDTLLRAILGDAGLPLTPVVTYTTRPQRETEIDGAEYNFVTEQFMRTLECDGKIIEKREYHTVHGIWYYFTAVFDISPGVDYITITTPQALKLLAEKFDKDAITIVCLEADDKLRLERSIARESRQREPNYCEVCRRYLADETDFSGLSLPCAHTIDANQNSDSCLRQFREVFVSLSARN